MKFSETIIDYVPVIGLEGRLDSASAAACDAHLLEKAGDGRGALIIDVSGVDHVSGSGLRSLVLAARFAASRQIGFAVCGWRGQAAEMVELADLAGQLNAHPDVGSAIREFGQ